MPAAGRTSVKLSKTAFNGTLDQNEHSTLAMLGRGGRGGGHEVGSPTARSVLHFSPEFRLKIVL